MSEAVQERRFSTDQIDLIAKHLKGVADDFKCPACAKENFAIYPHLAAIPIFTMPEKDISKEFYPAIMTACTHCGHVNHFVLPPRLMAALHNIEDGQAQ